MYEELSQNSVTFQAALGGRLLRKIVSLTFQVSSSQYYDAFRFLRIFHCILSQIISISKDLKVRSPWVTGIS